jgi:acyl-CoA synthetase (AMP-forming)/AMP-acid ligase II
MGRKQNVSVLMKEWKETELKEALVHHKERKERFQTDQEIISWCDGRLADFKVPHHIEFRDDFPRSAIGRIQKSLLKEEGQNLIGNKEGLAVDNT